MIFLDIKGKIPSMYYTEQDIKNTIEELIAKLEIKDNLGVEVIFVNEEEIHELNLKYRNVDRPTDVLSFPQDKIISSEFNILGSIVICGKIANERKEPIDELIKHGTLHLLGYDHDENEESWDSAAKKINCTF